MGHLRLVQVMARDALGSTGPEPGALDISGKLNRLQKKGGIVNPSATPSHKFVEGCLLTGSEIVQMRI
jgi:hypothetical protein